MTKRPGLSQQRTSTAPKPPHALTLSSGAFIDYGVFASLAPAFDSDGGQIGRETLGLVSTFKRERTKRRTDARADVQNALRDLAMTKLGKVGKESFEKSGESVIDGLGRLDLHLPPAYAESREALASLAGSVLGNDKATLDGVMRALDETILDDELNGLLVKNARALQRMQDLQAVRFRAGSKGKEIALTEGSEEWVLGRHVFASLTAIVGLRPRVEDPSASSSISSSSMSLIPAPATLHSLQRSAPRDPTPGYRGTLSSTRDFALIDNTTIRPSASAALLPPPPVAGSSTTPNLATTLPPTPSLSSTAGQYSYTPRPGATSYGYTGRVTTSTAGAQSSSGTNTPRGTATNPNAQYYPASAYHFSQTQSSPGMNGGYYNPTPSSATTPYTPSRAVPNLGGKIGMGTNGTHAHSQWGTPVSVGGGTGGIPGGMALPPHLRTAPSARAPMSPSPYAPVQYSGVASAPGTPVGAGMGGVAKPNGATWGPVTPLR